MKLNRIFSTAWKASLVVMATIASLLPIATAASATSRIIDWLNTEVRQPMAQFGLNTLTGLIPDLYQAMDIVSRELVGLLPSVTLDPSAARAAVGQSVYVHLAPASTASDITPGSVAPDDGDQTIGRTPITMTKARAVPFRWTGEEQRGVNTGPGYRNIRADQIAQAIRTLVNEVEADLAGLYTTFSRGYGTPGTTPFATDLTDSAQVLKILKDNGAPTGDLQLVIDTTAGVNVLKMGNLTKASEAGTIAVREQGILVPLHGLSLRESAAIKLHTRGTANGAYVTSGATAAGVSSIAIVTGAGTVVPGDNVTFAADTTNKYLIKTGVAAPGTIVLADPGARQVIPTANAMTVGLGYRANMAFHRSALVAALRAPALPEEGDMADDRMLITDPRSGITLEISMYKQYRRVRYEVALAWGVANIKPAHTAVLFG